MGMLYRLLQDIQLGGRAHSGARDVQDGPGRRAVQRGDDSPAPVRPLLTRPLVRVGLASCLLGCMGAAGAMAVGPSWILLALATAMVAGVLALALIEERRQPKERRCRNCGCTDDDPCIGTDIAIGLPVPCHWVQPDLCSACAEHVLP